MKNNRDFENVMFNAAGREHEKFIYNDAAFLLIIAIADDALFEYKMLNDLQMQEIPVSENKLSLRFKKLTLDQSILHNCTKAKRVTDEFMFRFAFTDIFDSTLRNAEYFCATSIHAIHCQLNKKVDK